MLGLGVGFGVAAVERGFKTQGLGHFNLPLLKPTNRKSPDPFLEVHGTY